MRINLGLGLRGPDIRPGLDRRHLIKERHRGFEGNKRSQKVIKGHRRSWKVTEYHGRSRKVKEGHGRYFPITGLTSQVRKVMCGVVVVVIGWWLVGL